MHYRVRENEITKVTPYELAIGRKMNEFSDYTNEDSSANISSCLDKRFFEVNRMVEWIDKAKDNIKIGQEKQKRIQNQSHQIVSKLNPGTIVYIKAPDLLVKGKLDERFFGPYTVHCSSNKGNYWILNEKNQFVSDY